ncbi:MAG: serine protease Do [Planctomycetota bacterium]|jgi:serine protease Do
MSIPFAATALLALASLATLGTAQSITAGSSAELPLEGLSKSEKLERRITPEVLAVRFARPAVVYIQTDTQTMVREWWGVRPRRGSSSGSGVVLTTDGYLITNYHVIKDAKEIRVSFEKSIDPTIYRANLLSFVEEEDLALLKIENPDGVIFNTIPRGTSSDLMIGERVLAIGNPYGHTHTVSVGIISGLHRGVKIGDQQSDLSFEFDDLIQTDASINPGNSGGPLLNINGELIGINNAVNHAAENIGFAIPIDRIMEVLEQQLISPDRYNAFLGFTASEGEDVTVASVIPGGPADLAGLRVGDQLLGFGKNVIDDWTKYRMMRLNQAAGEISKLRIRRENHESELTIQAWKKADGLIYERMGVQVEVVAHGRQRFLQISELLADGPADQIGLKTGDVIAAMALQRPGLHRPFTFPSRMSLAQFLDGIEPGERVKIEIQRGSTRYSGDIALD